MRKEVAQKAKELDQAKEQLRQASDAPPKVQGRIKELKAMNARLWQDGVDLQHAQRAAERDKETVLKVQQRSWRMGEQVLQRTAQTPMADGERKAERQNHKE